MKLFHMPGASFLAAPIVLEWTGATYEAVRMKRADVNGAEYLALDAVGAEEDLAPRSAFTAVARQAPAMAADFNIDELSDGKSVQLVGEVVGTVEYREGEGALLAIRPGLVAIEVNRFDSVFSWSDENYRGEAAMPFDNFSRYVGAGAITLRR